MINSSESGLNTAAVHSRWYVDFAWAVSDFDLMFNDGWHDAVPDRRSMHKFYDIVDFEADFSGRIEHQSLMRRDGHMDQC